MTIRMASVRLALVAVFVTMAAVLVPVPTALAGQDVVVDDFPLVNEPRIMDGRVYAIDSYGDNVIVGGTFSTIRNPAGNAPLITQKYLFKFNVKTGQIDTGFTPVLDGEVEGVQISDDGQWIYIGGWFVTVNGQTRQRIVKLSTADGSVDPTFVANANNEVKDIALTGDGLIVGGRFRYINGTLRERLASVDLTTGAVQSSFNIPITDSRYEWAQYVQELETTPDGHWLVVGGNFQTVGGLHREQVAVIDLSGATASIANWETG
ncbi:MAG: delta-60 repeat domain-containing protein, partial [Acidimicrobiia bacterium]